VVVVLDVLLNLGTNMGQAVLMCDIRGELRMIVPDHTSLLEKLFLLKRGELGRIFVVITNDRIMMFLTSDHQVKLEFVEEVIF